MAYYHPAASQRKCSLQWCRTHNQSCMQAGAWTRCISDKRIIKKQAGDTRWKFVIFLGLHLPAAAEILPRSSAHEGIILFESDIWHIQQNVTQLTQINCCMSKHQVQTAWVTDEWLPLFSAPTWRKLLQSTAIPGPFKREFLGKIFIGQDVDLFPQKLGWAWIFAGCGYLLDALMFFSVEWLQWPSQ